MFKMRTLPYTLAINLMINIELSIGALIGRKSLMTMING